MTTFKIVFMLAASCVFVLPSQAQDGSVYDACCGASPVEFTQDDNLAYVYVPNVFTPNDDGVNDYFMPVVNQEVVEVVDYLVYESDSNEVVFYRQSINFDDKENYAWNGMRSDGTVYKGLFRYSMLIVLKTGEHMQVEGRACRIACDSEAQVFQTLEGCFYPAQVNDQGVFDSSLPNKENGGCY